MVDDLTEEEMAKTIIRTIREVKPHSVRQLVDLLEESSSIRREEIVDFILRLRREGRIRLEEPTQPVPRRLAGYLKTGRARWYWTTITLAVAATIAVVTIPEQLFPLVYIRYLLGTVYVVCLPGYALTKALFPQTTVESQRSIDSIERVALSIGLSLALVPLVGLLLNYTPWGINLTFIVLSLLLLIVVFSLAAIMREHRTEISRNPPSDTER